MTLRRWNPWQRKSRQAYLRPGSLRALVTFQVGASIAGDTELTLEKRRSDLVKWTRDKEVVVVRRVSCDVYTLR